MTTTSTLAPLTWQRQAAGFYTAREESYEVFSVRLDDGGWWIIRYPDSTTGDPFATKREAIAAVEAWRS